MISCDEGVEHVVSDSALPKSEHIQTDECTRTELSDAKVTDKRKCEVDVEQVLIHECSDESRIIRWFSTEDVRQVLESLSRYGDTPNGTSFHTLWEEAKLFWTSARIIEYLLPIIDPSITNPASGRVIEWTHTNYAACKPFLDMLGENVANAYGFELKRTRRHKFDCYCRRGSPFVYLQVFDADGEPKSKLLRTSIAQLHFFEFAVRRGTLRYIDAHLEEIRAHMSRTLSARKKEGKKRKRQKLCAQDKSSEWIATASGSETFDLI